MIRVILEKTEFPKITNINLPNIIQKGVQLEIDIDTKNADSVLYFLTDSNNNSISELINIDSNPTKIIIDAEKIKELGVGAKDLKIFAISDSVLKPDYYSTSFLMVENNGELPDLNQDNIEYVQNNSSEFAWLLVPIIIGIITMIYIKKRKK